MATILLGLELPAIAGSQGEIRSRGPVLRPSRGGQRRLERRWVYSADRALAPPLVLADRMARQTRSGVAGISMWVTPNSASASTTALITAPSAGVVPPSPAGRMPSGCVGLGTSLSSVAKKGRVSARGIA